MPIPPRLLPELPLPPYAYVAGRYPHPTRASRGHSFGQVPPPVEAVDPARWQNCVAYLRGIDLFNHGYYWEAHETWEHLWQAAGRRGATADFFKGLIALAAAGYKAREGRPAGVRRHAARARRLFEEFRRSKVGQASCLSSADGAGGARPDTCPALNGGPAGRFMGLSIAELIEYSIALEQRAARPTFVLAPRRQPQ